jgi:hypothetical protein
MIARWAICVLLLACGLLIRSDSVFNRSDGPVIPPTIIVDDYIDRAMTLATLPSGVDPTVPARRAEIVAATHAGDPAYVSQMLPYIVYYAYSEVPLNPKPIDVISDSIAQLPLGSCRDEVRRAADVFALSYPVMMAFALIESTCRPHLKTGSYIGLFQLSKYEFNRYGRTGGDIYNPRDNAMATAHKFVVEAIAFQHAVGRYPTPFDRYCIHQQGLEGCIQHQAKPDRIAWNSMCVTQEGQTKGEKWCRRAIWGNVPSNLKASIAGGVEALTSGAFLDIWRGRVAHFTKLMTGGISHARADALFEPFKPGIAETPPAKKKKVAEKSRSKKSKVADKARSKKSKVADKARSKRTKLAEKK